jgi:hypothetical protein
MRFFLLGLIPAGLGAYFYFNALDIMKRKLPPQLDEHELRFMVDASIWTPSAPAEARRSYVLSCLGGIGFLFLYGLGLFSYGQLWAGAIFELIALYGAVYLGWNLLRILK